jgi:hypothetical protein
MSKARDLADFISTGSILSDGTIESTEISGVTADATEINKLDGLTADTTELNKLDGVTATTAELNKLAGTTATTSDFDKLSNVTASATELNYMSGATSSIQSQLDNISVTSGSLTKSFTNGETASITLSSALSTAPVVGVTKEVAQTGISSKGAWDVNATASNYELHNTAYDTTLTPNTSTSTLTLGTGSFASTDVGKRIQGNGGDVILTSTAGAYDTTGGSDFTDTSTIASGSWTMHGLKSAGATDGLTLTGYSGIGNISNATATGNSFSLLSGDASDDLTWKPDGTKFYTTGEGNANVYEYSCSTAWDITTATINHTATLSNMTTVKGMCWNPNGLSFFVGCQPTGTSYPQYVKRYDLSTAWSISSINSSTTAVSQGRESYVQGLFLNTNGTKMFITGNSGSVYEFSMSTAYDPNTLSYTTSFATPQVNIPVSLFFNSDGTRMFSGSYGGSPKYIAEYDLTTGFDLSTASYSGNSFGVSITPTGMFFKPDLSVMFLADQAGSTVTDYSLETTNVPTSQYHIAATNSGGQIDTEYWTDINSMTADQSLGDGEAYYAVSTDDRTTWSVAKASDGVRPIVRDNAGTWQYNNDQGTTVGNSLANGSYSSSFDLSTISTASNGICEIQWVNNGNHLMVLGDNNSYVTRWNASTPYDINSLSLSQNMNVSSQEIYLTSMHMSPDGYHLYVGGNQGNDVNEYTLTTAFDLFSASFTRNPVSVGNIGAIWFKPDGTKMYTMSFNGISVTTYNLSTAWDTSTASSQGGFNLPNSSTSGASAMVFSDDGYHLYVSFGAEDVVKHYTLSTAWDVSTVSTNPASLSYASQGNNMEGLTFNSDFTEMHTGTGSTLYKYDITQSSYTTATTWTNATTNDEFYALQQALGATEFNRMDKTQLDAVADGSHFTLGDTLDLAIALKQDTASASLPTSDGVSINYDAQALNQGAVLGTDYDYDFPDSTTVRITSNAAQNLKIRVV